MSDTHIYGTGSMRGMEIRPLTGDQQRTLDLVELADSGFRIFYQRDLDHTHRPWLVAKEDSSIWCVERGIPASGFKSATHAVLVDNDALRWGFLVAAKHSGVGNAPTSLAELEARAAKADEQAKRQAAEAERNLAALRAAAQPVTAGDVDRTLVMTLRGAAEQIDLAGGKVEVDRDRLIVRLPPGAGNMWSTEPLDAARLLYLAEPTVVAAVKSGRDIPDVFVTPAGAPLT